MQSVAQKFELAQAMYAPKIRTFSEKSFRFLPGYERQDLEADMLEVLWLCVQSYDPDKGARFSTLFWTAAKRRLISIRRRFGAQKRSAEWVILNGDELAAAIDSVISEFSAEDYAVAFLSLRELRL
jgi:DNA-directed RNA polymerase specialized sigma24 family protein